MARKAPKDFGIPPPRLLAAARFLAGLSQMELAAEAGLNKSVIERYEAGVTVMRSDKLSRVVAALEVRGVLFVGTPSSEMIGVLISNALAAPEPDGPEGT